MKKSIFAIIFCTTHLLQADAQFNINFDANQYKSQTLKLEGKKIKVRAYENIIYVENPVDTAYQKMNVYIPEEYFKDKSINGYTALTAPIFFPNKVGGYMQAQPASTSNKPMDGRPPLNGEMPPRGDRGGRENGRPPMDGRPSFDGESMPPMGDGGNGEHGRPPFNHGAMDDKKHDGMPPMGFDGPKQNTVLLALSRGYIVASAGARGRTLKDVNNVYTGKAPAAIVDLKAAIRYLKFNDSKMPGDANKIISNGTSAGGAMSALLGATGNNADYEPYLNALGAAKANDDVFAVSAYCPITNLDNADMAYEWQFYGINTYKKGGPMSNDAPESTLDNNQIVVSEQLKNLFPDYLNSLGLKDKSGNALSLEANGNGNFKDLVKSYVMASAQKALDKGQDLTAFSFLSIINKKVTKIDFEAYLKYIGRQKTPPAFDALNLSSPETNVFGTASINNQHFTAYSTEHSRIPATRADALIVKMMNPMNYIGQANTTTSKYWRIRHGSKDKDTGLSISIMLATLLENKGYTVNMELPWEKTHSGDYDLEELFQWIDQICKQ